MCESMGGTDDERTPAAEAVHTNEAKPAAPQQHRVAETPFVIDNARSLSLPLPQVVGWLVYIWLGGDAASLNIAA